MLEIAAESGPLLTVVPSYVERKCMSRHRHQRAEEGAKALVVVELETRLEQVNRRFPSFQIVVSSLDELGLDPRKIFFSGPNEIVA